MKLKMVDFEVYFGDGVLGQAVADGNIVILDYITCNRDEANGANHLHYQEMLVVLQTSQLRQLNNANGGDSTETIKSIKYNAI